MRLCSSNRTPARSGVLRTLVALLWVGLLAAPSWGVVDTLGVAEREDHSPFLTTDDVGHPIAIWVATAPDTNAAGRFDEIVLSERTGSGWSAPSVVAGPGNFFGPEIAFTTAGDRWICWAEHDGTDSSVRLRWDGGVEPRYFTLGDPAQPDVEPSFCVARGDTVFVVWQGWRSDDYEILLATGTPAGFGAPVVISGCDLNDREPQIVWGDDKAWIVWSSYEGEPYNLSHRTFDGVSLSPLVNLTENTKARSVHPEITFDEPTGLLWVTSIMVNQAWSGFNDHEWPALYDRGSPRVFAYDGSTRYFPAGLDADNRYPLLDMEALSYERFDYGSGILMYDRFGSGVDVETDDGGRVWFFHKQVGSLTEGGVPNRYFGAVGTNFRGGGWGSPTEVLDLRTSVGWEAPVAVAAGDTLWVAWTADERVPSIDTYLNSFGHDLDLVITGVPLDNTSSPSPTLVPIGPPVIPPVCVLPPRPEFTVQDGGTTYRLLWGDNHRHTHDLSWDGTADPSLRDAVMYSLDWLDLDFLCTSDHAEKFGKAQWAWVAKWSEIFDVPGRFRVFAGYERSMRGGAGGDQNCFYRDPAQFTEASAAYPSVASWHEMYAAQQGIDVIAVPHTMAQCTGDATIDWIHLADGNPAELPAPLRLAEVYQAARESFEYAGCPRQYAGCVTGPDTGWMSVPLALGMRLGMVAASDHDVRIAYLGVLAEDRSRDAIFEGMSARRTSGSTRALHADLEFRVADTLQGGEAVSMDAPEIQVRVEAEEPLFLIEINKDGDPAWFSASFVGTDTTITFTDPDPVIPGTSSFYYVRVTDQLGRLFWTSPVWVDFGFPTAVPDLPAAAASLSASAHPNPFRSEVRLELAGMGVHGGRMRIHDVTGRLVRSFLVPPGGAGVTWDGRDAAGSPVAAGVYWAVTQAGGETARNRLVRIR